LKRFIEKETCDAIDLFFRERRSSACDPFGIAEVTHEAMKIACKDRIDPHEKMAESEQICAEDAGEFDPVAA
jgi:hypothetical protein